MKEANLPRYRYLAREKSWAYWSRYVAVGIVLFPLSLHHLDFRATFAQGLSVSAHKASPAYAAFEDLRENYETEPSKLTEPTRILAAGKKFVYRPADVTTRIRVVSLKGLTIHAPAALEEKRVLVAGGEPGSADRRRRETMRATDRALAALRTKKLRVLEDEDMGNEELTTPSLAAVAQKLVEAELQKAGAAGDRIFRPRSAPASIRSSVLPSPPSEDLVTALSEPPKVPSGLGSATFASAAMTMRNPNPSGLRPLWLTGQVEMTGGLAFVGPETQLSIARVFNGQTFETGRVFVTEGKFEIRVRENTGYLVADLRTRDGRTLGHGEINLLSVGTASVSSDRISDLLISLRPTSEGASFRAINAFEGGTRRVANTKARIEIQAYSDAQKVNSEGIVTEPTLSHDSSFVARALAKNNWSTLVVGQAREEQDVRLFSDSLVEALLSLNSANNSEHNEARRLSVIWGQLNKEGQPLQGAQVELAGEYTPIYFNEAYIPDPKQMSTSKNGLFAFIRVPAGVQALRIRKEGKTYPAQVFPSEEKHVSYLELDVRDKVVTQFRVFDGMNINHQMSARLRLVGTDESLDVSGSDFVEYSSAANPFMLEADAGAQYEISRVTVSGSPHVVHVPMVDHQWLSRIASEQNLVSQPGRGTIVGYIDENGFEVELTGYKPRESMQIVYFDGQGNTLNARSGISGGGFIIFNAPPGLQTLYVHPSQSKQTFSQIVVAEPEFVQVVTH